MTTMQVDVLIRGDGAVGRCLALALSHQGLRVALLGRGAVRPNDVRAYALNASAQALLARLKVWDGLPADAKTPVLDMQLAGDEDTGRLNFSAWQSHRTDLAVIVDAAELDLALDTALRFAPRVQRVEAEVPHQLLALCEGREATGLAARGVQVHRQAYGHHALATRWVSDVPHQGRAWQWFGAGAEILGMLPMDRPEPGRSFAMVWSQPAAEAERRLALSPDALAAELNDRTQGRLGSLVQVGSAQAWPLSLLRATPMVRPGLALLGDCAHQVHPLAGQGLNLGLADVAALAAVLDQREPWRPLGDLSLLRRYERQRALDTWMMATVTDSLWHGFAHSAPWARVLRNQGMAWVDRLSPVKRWLTQQALGPASHQSEPANAFHAGAPATPNTTKTIS
jgi:2-polyprenyl-6-methoxyphenol hydroxylase-like FAD-dependent oxidoreductase